MNNTQATIASRKCASATATKPSSGSQITSIDPKPVSYNKRAKSPLTILYPKTSKPAARLPDLSIESNSKSTATVRIPHADHGLKTNGRFVRNYERDEECDDERNYEHDFERNYERDDDSDEHLYGFTDDWEDYYDSVYN